MESTDKKAIRGYFGKDMDESSSSEDEDDGNNSKILSVRNIADTVLFISLDLEGDLSLMSGLEAATSCGSECCADRAPE